jgi:replicative DNA helicase
VFDREAEDVTIGSILEGGKATLAEARDILSDNSDEFHQEKLRVIWDNLIELDDKNIPFDVVILNDQIKGKMGIDLSYLTQLMYKGNYTRIKYYAELVHNKYITRQSIRIFDEFKRRIIEGEDAKGVLSESLIISSNLLNSEKTQEMLHVKDISLSVFENIEERYQTKKQLQGISSGFKGLDIITGGIRGITVLAGRPGTGKTSICLNVALNTSEENPTAIFSLEMDKEELAEKLISCESMVDSYRLENGMLMLDSDWPKLAHALGKIHGKNIYIDDSPEMKASQISIRARRMKQQYGIKLIIIDYLQLIEPEKHEGNRNSELTTTMRILKKLNRELKIPILLLSQMNRRIENSPEKKPNLSDLRDSGSIEQDAHIVMFLYQEEEQYGDIVSVQNYIPKNRKGKKNVTLDFKFLPAISKFEFVGIHQNNTQQKEVS